MINTPDDILMTSKKKKAGLVPRFFFIRLMPSPNGNIRQIPIINNGAGANGEYQ